MTDDPPTHRTYHSFWPNLEQKDLHLYTEEPSLSVPREVLSPEEPSQSAPEEPSPSALEEPSQSAPEEPSQSVSRGALSDRPQRDPLSPYT
ncbi:uncharacterized [Tachysurus ichikawai]